MHPEPKQYMNINEFLDLYFAAIDSHALGTDWIGNMANHRQPANRIQETLDNRQDISNDVKQMISALLVAVKDKDDPNNADAANDFINNVATITVFRINDSIVTTPDFATTSILRMINNKLIKKPEHAYRLLQMTLSSHPKMSGQLRRMVLKAVLHNPNATAVDASEYCKTCSLPDEILAVINDFKIKTDDIVAKQLAKVSLTTADWEKLKSNEINPLMRMVDTLKEISNDAKHVQIANSLTATLENEYSTEKIFGLNNRDYVQQYKDQAEMQIAKMKPEMEQTQQDLEKLQNKSNIMRDTLDKAYAEIQKLRAQINESATKQHKAQAKYDMLKATVNMYTEKAKDRISNARGIDLTKGKDLTNIFEKLAQDLQKQYQ